LIFDARGNLMSPTYSVRGRKRYRYYVSRLVRGGRKEGSHCRVGAEQLDRLVVQVLGQQLSVPELLSEAASGTSSAAARMLVQDNIERIVVGRGEIEIVWKATRTSSASGETGDGCDTPKGYRAPLPAPQLRARKEIVVPEEPTPRRWFFSLWGAPKGTARMPNYSSAAICLLCQDPMQVVRTIPAVARLPEALVFYCEGCGKSKRANEVAAGCFC
jgi:hypothetical protein